MAGGFFLMLAQSIAKLGFKIMRNDNRRGAWF